MYIHGTENMSKDELKQILQSIDNLDYVTLFHKSINCTKCGHEFPVVLKGKREAIEQDLDKMLLCVSQYQNKWRKYKLAAKKKVCPKCGGRLTIQENPT